MNLKLEIAFATSLAMPDAHEINYTGPPSCDQKFSLMLTGSGQIRPLIFGWILLFSTL